MYHFVHVFAVMFVDGRLNTGVTSFPALLLPIPFYLHRHRVLLSITIILFLLVDHISHGITCGTGCDPLHWHTSRNHLTKRHSLAEFTLAYIPIVNLCHVNQWQQRCPSSSIDWQLYWITSRWVQTLFWNASNGQKSTADCETCSRSNFRHQNRKLLIISVSTDTRLVSPRQRGKCVPTLDSRTISRGHVARRSSQFIERLDCIFNSPVSEQWHPSMSFRLNK